MYRDHGSTGFGKLLFGLILGFIGGILLAPRSGKETLEQLKTSTEGYRSQAKEYLDTNSEGFKTAATERTTMIKEKVEEARMKLQEQIDTASERARSTVSDVRAQAEEAVGVIKGKANDLITEARAKGEELRQNVSDSHIKDAAEKIEQLKRDIEETKTSGN